MDTSILTPHFFNIPYLTPLILLAIPLCVRCFNGDPKGLVIGVTMCFLLGRKSGVVTGKALAVLRYCSTEGVKLLHEMQGAGTFKELILMGNTKFLHWNMHVSRRSIFGNNEERYLIRC
jgi:hypothetical protein